MGTAVVDVVLPGTLIRIIKGFEDDGVRVEVTAGRGLRVVVTGEALTVRTAWVVPLVVPTPVPLTRLFWTGAVVTGVLDGTVV